MDKRIGVMVKNGKPVFYAYVKGLSNPEFQSENLAEVEAALNPKKKKTSRKVLRRSATEIDADPTSKEFRCVLYYRDDSKSPIYTVRAKNRTEARLQIADAEKSDNPRHLRMSYRVQWLDADGRDWI